MTLRPCGSVHVERAPMRPDPASGAADGGLRLALSAGSQLRDRDQPRRPTARGGPRHWCRGTVGIDPVPSGCALEQAVDDVIEMFSRWSVIVTGSWYHVDGRVGSDWKHPFRTALFSGKFDDLPPELRPDGESR